MVKQISKNFPNVIIKLIGPIDPLATEKIKELENLTNVKILGKANYDSLPQIISTFNVGIIPLIQSDKVYKLNSAKFLQYFAANIPIVSVPFYEFKEFKEDVNFCISKEEFINSINKILNSEHHPINNYEKLKNWDWDNISTTASDQLNKLLEKQ